MTDENAAERPRSQPPDLALVSEAEWREAQRRVNVIRPLVALHRCPRHEVAAAASELGLSQRQVYRLVRRCREADGALTAMLPSASSGGRGGTRLPLASEALLQEQIVSAGMPRRRVSAEALVQEVRRAGSTSGVRAPSPSTIRRRLVALDLQERRSRGDAQSPQVVTGRTPIARHPLDAVQMDHTKVDLILVDPIEREPIGRPWVTLAIDVHSRCIAGFHLSLEAPSRQAWGCA